VEYPPERQPGHSVKSEATRRATEPPHAHAAAVDGNVL